MTTSEVIPMSEKYQSLRRALEVFELLQGDEYVTKRQLADSVGVEARTVKDYLDVFCSYDWPIERKHARGFRLASHAAIQKFSEEELLYLAILMAQGAATLPGEKFEKLSRKLLNMLPPSSLEKVETLHRQVEKTGAAVHPVEVLSAIGKCLADPCLQIVADYQKTDDEETQRREVVPIKLRFESDFCYVDVYDLQKKGHRSFRLDRFKRVSLLRQSEPISRPSEVKKAHKWDFGENKPIVVRIETTERLHNWLRENPAHSSQRLAQQNGTYQAEYTVRRLSFFVDWVVSLRGARAMEPAELTEAVRSRCRALLETGGTMNVEWG